MLLPLQLRFRDHVRHAVEFLPRQKDKVQHDSQSQLICMRTLTKNKQHALYSGWLCGSRLQSGIGRSCSSCIGSALLLRERIGPTPAHAGSLSIMCAGAADEPNLLLTSAQQCLDSPCHKNHIYSRFAEYAQGPRRCSPTQFGLPTSPGWIFGSTQIYCAHDLGSSSSSRGSKRRCSSSRVRSSKRLIRRIRPRLNGSSPPLSPPDTGTRFSSYRANRPPDSSTAV